MEDNQVINNEPVVDAAPVAEETQKVEVETVETPAEEPAAVETPAEEPAAVEAPAEEPAAELSLPQTKEEIINRLKELAESDAEVSRQEADALKSRFYRLSNAEAEAAKNKFVEEGGNPDDFQPVIDPSEQMLKDLLGIIREKRAAAHMAQEKVKEENYLKKLQIIEKIKAILETPDEVNKSYSTFRQLQTEWNEIKEVPAEKATELWKTYQLHVEKFYDTLKLNNEFRAYDFKKNLEAKNLLIEAAQKLADEKDVVSAFRQLQQLHQQFREIGPVARELREDVWNRFKEASTVINKRHQEFFESRKEEEQANLDQKTAICEIIESFDVEGLTTFAEWNKITDQITALQTKWKTIGFAPQKMNQKIYDRFRAACDNFFQRKSEYFKNARESMSDNLKKKRELVEKAEALKDSQDWKATTDELVAIQKEWKTIGAVPKKYGDEIWKQFNAACDAFFEAKKAATSSQFSEQRDNLAKKKAIVDRLAAIVPEEAEDLRQTLKDAQAEWNEIGHVPFKEKDKVYKALREQMDRLYNFLGESASKRRIERFKNEVTPGDDKVLDRLTRQEEILAQEIKTYENNLGFLSLSKGSKGSSLVDEINHKLDKLRADLKELKEKKALLNS